MDKKQVLILLVLFFFIIRASEDGRLTDAVFAVKRANGLHQKAEAALDVVAHPLKQYCPAAVASARDNIDEGRRLLSQLSDKISAAQSSSDCRTLAKEAEELAGAAIDNARVARQTLAKIERLGQLMREELSRLHSDLRLTERLAKEVGELLEECEEQGDLSELVAVGRKILDDAWGLYDEAADLLPDPPDPRGSPGREDPEEAQKKLLLLQEKDAAARRTYEMVIKIVPGRGVDGEASSSALSLDRADFFIW